MIRTTPPRDPYNIGGSVPLRIGPTVKIAVWTLYQLRQIPATSCSAERSFSALRRIKMTDIQREKKIQCHVVGHKMPSVTESRGTGRNFLAIYADADHYWFLERLQSSPYIFLFDWRFLSLCGMDCEWCYFVILFL